MKKLLILIILVVAGYFAYQYFIGTSPRFSTTPRPTFNMYSLPEKCQDEGEMLKTAFNRHKTGELKQVEVNGYTQHFRGCLRREGLTKPEIDEAYDGIKDSS